MTTKKIALMSGVAIAALIGGGAGIAIAASETTAPHLPATPAFEQQARDQRPDGQVIAQAEEEEEGVEDEEGAEDEATEEDDGGDETGEEGSSTEGSLGLIPQPVVEGNEFAPLSRRVDLAMPTFSRSTVVDNPLFPVSSQASVLLLGQVDGEAFRSEVTLLPWTRIIDWQGQKVETLVSQYVAYLDGRIEEVAYDLYAQDDGGSVWYFGEDVSNFADGVIVDTHGTWTAGKDGPAAMIMPANPKVGDVYRPENIPGLVFEEVTVKAVDQVLDGPFGPVHGGIAVEELHMTDAIRENKTFAPGYGEFFTGAGSEVEALALAVPTDARAGPPPAELVTLESGAAEVFAAARSKDWAAAAVTLKEMTGAWESYKAADTPEMIGTRMTGALKSLNGAIGARKTRETMQAAIDARQSSLDLQLRHRPPVAIDLARFDLWATQIQVDAAAGDAAAVNGDFFTLDLIRDRIVHGLDTADAVRINTQLDELVTAVGDEDLAAVTEGAQGLRDIVAELPPAN
jgi:hypothetical protein